MFDYSPPIRRGAVMPDLDGNLWILPASPAQSKAGELVFYLERTILPAKR